ncbi:hypothetical protein PFISCL1PPCAC_9157, partial [Pristionchus fissidentatus]
GRILTQRNKEKNSNGEHNEQDPNTERCGQVPSNSVPNRRGRSRKVEQQSDDAKVNRCRGRKRKLEDPVVRSETK